MGIVPAAEQDRQQSFMVFFTVALKANIARTSERLKFQRARLANLNHTWTFDGSAAARLHRDRFPRNARRVFLDCRQPFDGESPRKGGQLQIKLS